MEPPMDIDEDPRDNLDDDGDNNSNEVPHIPPDMMVADEDLWGDDDDDEAPPDLRLLGSDYRNIGVRAIFNALESFQDGPPGAVIILYLLYPDLRQDIVRELRAWILFSRSCGMSRIALFFKSLGELDVAEHIEREHAGALLEFVDILGPLIVEAGREVPSRRLMAFTMECMSFPLHGPLGAVVVATLLQYAQSVKSFKTLYLLCFHPHRAFHPDEVELLVSSILNLKQLEWLDIAVNMTGDFLMELLAGLKELQSLSYLHITTGNANAQEVLPNESHVIRNIQQAPSLKTLHLTYAVIGESTVNLFSSMEATYTSLHLDRCFCLIGGDDENRDPSELSLAVALARNTRLKELCISSVRGSGEFWQSIEQGLLRNGTLQTLKYTTYDCPAQQRIPELAYIGLMQSIRLHPSLRQLVLDMSTWSGRVVDAVCSLVRGNTSLRSIGFFLVRDVEDNSNTFDPEWIGSVLQALQGNRTMINVRMEGGSSFGDQNWNRLAELLTVNDSIECFNLDAGDDSIPERIIELLQRVESNNSLKRLGLKNARFRPYHASALADVLTHHFSIVSLVYNEFHLDEELRGDGMTISCSAGALERLLTGILDLNYYGRKYMTTEPNSVVHGVTLLSHVSSNLDAIYYHIRENPRLCDRREWKPDF